MPISFKKSAAAAAPKKSVSATPENDEPEQSTSAKATKAAWYKRGAASAKAVEKYEQEMQEKWEEGRRMFRFWLEEGGDARITFIDGDLTSEGHLDILTYREHRLKGPTDNSPPVFYTCTAELEPCPICQSGNDAGLVGALTIIDHREVTSKKGKKYHSMPRLFVCTKNTIQKLQKYATTRDGLAGCTFDVSRIGENAPRVGSDYEFVQKDKIEELQQHFTTEIIDPKTKKKHVETKFVPADYDKEIGYIDAPTLRDKYGFGAKPIGYESKSQGLPQKSGGINFKGKL